MTGGRLRRVAQYLHPDEPFCFTYGDGVGDINIGELIAFHRKHGLDATLTGANPPGRFGALEIEDDYRVTSFREKPTDASGMINAGFFVLSPKVLELIDDDDTSWEREPLERLALQGQLAAYPHHSFWQPMDTLRDKNYLEELWASGKAPWKVWK
jgi:glucose-1-phosphate cytidylyltransferase